MGSDAVDKYDAFVAFTNENEARAIEFLQSVVDGGASLAHIKNKVHLSTSQTRTARRTTQRKKTQLDFSLCCTTAHCSASEGK